MRYTAAEQRIYAAVFKACSAFPPVLAVVHGRQLARDYPEFEALITLAYVDAVIEWIPPEVYAWRALGRSPTC